MEGKHEAPFVEFAESRQRGDFIYLISGSDYPKIASQLFQTTADVVNGIFCCLGNELVRRGKYVYRSYWPEVLDEQLLTQCEQFVEYSKYPLRTGVHIEKRTGMLNISSVGRRATTEQRRDYYIWDKEHGERAEFCSLINKHYPEVEASVGGMISIDISKKGKDKSQILTLFGAMGRYDPITYFGDRFMPGGNDKPIMDRLQCHPNKVYKVESHNETFDILRTL